MNATCASSSPFSLQIEITSHCNLKCKMCPLTTQGTLSSLRPGHMEDVTWSRVRELAREVGRVNLTGFGEPFSNPRFLLMLRELDGLGVIVGFSTNGIGVTPDLVAELAALPHLKHVNVSIDSPDPALYKAIRGGSLAKALQGLRALAAGLPRSKWLTVSSVVMDGNLESLAGFPRLLAEMGVGTYLLQGLVEWNPELGREQLVHGRRVPEHLQRITAACRQWGIYYELHPDVRLDLELNHPAEALRRYHGGAELNERQTKQCCVPWDLPFINKDGQVFPCCYGDHTAVLGDLREQSFAEIWNGARYRQFRADLLSGCSAPPICRRCTAAPTGPHPFQEYAAQIVHERSVLGGRQRLRLVIRNVGARTWAQETRLRIGTTEKRDRPSAFYHCSWIGPTRVGTFLEDSVPPGAEATFLFVAVPRSGVEVEAFQLLVEGLCWLPGTRFEVRPRRHLVDRARVSCRQLLYRGQRLLQAGRNRFSQKVPG